MMGGMLRWAFGLGFVFVCVVGCRPEPGAPDYESQEQFDFDAQAGAVETLEGPSPFVPGELRLSLGVFYEGGASQTYIVDGATRHFYIYQNEFTSNATFEQAFSEDRVEGVSSDQIEHQGDAWWGGGIHWDVPQDLSSWGTLYIHLKSEDDAFAEVELSMESGEADGVGTVFATDYGFENDGEWHQLEVPLSAFADSGVQLDDVSIPLRFGGMAGETGEFLYIDNLYLSP